MEQRQMGKENHGTWQMTGCELEHGEAVIVEAQLSTSKDPMPNLNTHPIDTLNATSACKTPTSTDGCDCTPALFIDVQLDAGRVLPLSVIPHSHHTACMHACALEIS